MINIKNKLDLITVDLRIKQIRYLVDVNEHGFIHFIDLSRDDVAAYEYLFKEDKDRFINSLIEDVKTHTGIVVNKEDLVYGI